MPKRRDIKRILVIGSGPIVIGQACEFDYSGTQAVKALREEGYTVILVNSNPATVMTDPGMADRTYIEPLDPEVVAQIIARERPDALLPTLGGQTALNLAVALDDMGVLRKFGVECIGADVEVIKRAEQRELYKKAMEEIGLDTPKSGLAHSLDEAKKVVKLTGLPVIIRPSFTLGGQGQSIALTEDELFEGVRAGLDASPVHQVLIEESIFGWKEFEYEVMRDKNDNAVIICCIENIDPMGIHTGDSVTVTPPMTLSDQENQYMRNASIAILRKIGVETGGSNVQFAMHPETGRIVAVEMNPRVSRSSALASKATGFPIAKIAAKLAVGYTLDEIPNDITKKTPASFEPTIDYVAIKMPRFTFDKFPGTPRELTTQMKSVGEVMALGRTFLEAFFKGLRALEYSEKWFEEVEKASTEFILDYISRNSPERMPYIIEALRRGIPERDIADATKIDPWFIGMFKKAASTIQYIKDNPLDYESLCRAKSTGLSDEHIAYLKGKTELEIRELRKTFNIKPVYKMVDTCAAEFEAFTPYFYSTYDTEDETIETDREKVLILGSGPNRIGQGIEFDYCCVQASFELRALSYETIMVNSNPETVSTDYDTSDRLYFEPVTFEDVMNIIEKERPIGIIVQFGGQTPLNIARLLEEKGARILGTSTKSIDRAESREEFAKLIDEMKLTQALNGTARSVEEAIEIARMIGYPVLLRPSYVLGGRKMVILYDEPGLKAYLEGVALVSDKNPLLIDQFLEDAFEYDIDAVSDGEKVVIAGVMHHIEEAGVHSGDSACAIPPVKSKPEWVEEMKRQTRLISKALGVVGLINIQFAVKDDLVYILEVNPRASRTVPFVSKATSFPLARIATAVIMGKTLEELGLKSDLEAKYVSVKEVVLPFDRFPGVDPLLGPEMRSTGEVMGTGASFGEAFYKAELGAGTPLPTNGTVFISVNDYDKPTILPVAKKLSELGLRITATKGTAAYLWQHGVWADVIQKIHEGHPNVLDYIKHGKLDLFINTPLGKASQMDDYLIRLAAIKHRLPYTTTTSAAKAAVEGIEAKLLGHIFVRHLQENPVRY
ncbi:MAG: carbamoyl-phosphate synthase large subunit [Spirochaetota bacterium]